MKAKYSMNQFLAASYNAGDKNTLDYIDKRMIGPAANDYSNRVDQHFSQAQQLLCGSGAYTCN